MKTLTRFEALKAAVKAVKTQRNFAQECGVSESNVSQWLSRTKQLPAEYVLIAERISGVSRHDLRPDIYPRAVPAEHRPSAKMVDGSHADRFYASNIDLGHAA